MGYPGWDAHMSSAENGHLTVHYRGAPRLLGFKHRFPVIGTLRPKLITPSEKDSKGIKSSSPYIIIRSLGHDFAAVFAAWDHRTPISPNDLPGTTRRQLL